MPEGPPDKIPLQPPFPPPPPPLAAYSPAKPLQGPLPLPFPFPLSSSSSSSSSSFFFFSASARARYSSFSTNALWDLERYDYTYGSLEAQGTTALFLAEQDGGARPAPPLDELLGAAHHLPGDVAAKPPGELEVAHLVCFVGVGVGGGGGGGGGRGGCGGCGGCGGGGSGGGAGAVCLDCIWWSIRLLMKAFSQRIYGER